MDHFSDDAPDPDLSTVDGLIECLERQARLLIAVATGGPRIEKVQWQYPGVSAWIERLQRSTESGALVS